MDRDQLHDILIDVSGLASTSVYFQPPENLKLAYPCIVYSRDRGRTAFADDTPYRYVKKYQVTVIDPDPDSAIPDMIAGLKTVLHVRCYKVNNLNHDVFTLFTP